jgi:hypothetical protein
MYDRMTGRYTFACPVTGEVSLPLSAFRVIDRLPGAAHPAVYKITFSCECGDEHEGLVAHDDLDWAPLAGGDVSFVNMMTSKLESAAADLLELAATQIRVGEWPWSFFCYPEELARPAFPSSFALLAPGDGSVGVAVRCSACGRLSVNLVSQAHVDVPWHNDRHVGVVEHVFPEDARQTMEEFQAELYSARFDARRLSLG